MHIILRLLLNIALVWGLSILVPTYFVVSGGMVAFIAIGIIISILNLLLRPILVLVTFPLRILTHILAAIVVNMLFLFVTEKLVAGAAIANVNLDIRGGLTGFLLVAAVFGILNWILKGFAKS